VSQRPDYYLFKSQEPCWICDDKDTVAVGNLSDHLTKERFDVAFCPLCQFYFLREPPNRTEIQRYYQSEAGLLMRRRPSALVAQLQRLLYALELKPLMQRLHRGASVIDIGAGDGSLVLYLQKCGFQVEARDFYPAQHWDQEQIPYRPIDFSSRSLEALKMHDGSPPDAIIMRHVLEHLHDPLDVLKMCLRAGVRYLYLVVPNVHSIWARYFGPNWFYWDPPRHLSHFSMNSLSIIAMRAGFQLTFQRYYGIDEVITSLYRRRLLRSTQICQRDLILRSLNPKGILASLSSSLSYAFFRTVCSVIFESARESR